jgi:catechol 2,3-dioxygenase-like lactoylglutathione lyase family enzyme
MIDHVSTYASDFAATRAFYLATLPLLGYPLQVDNVAKGVCAFGPAGKPVFWVIGSSAADTPRHLAFAAPHRAAVDAWYDAALEAGVRDNGEPGLRPEYHANYYGAFVIDPDGNNVEACCHGPA